MSDKRKQIPLRLSAELYGEIASWANDEFRSVNGQIEYLLTECVKKRKGPKKTTALVSNDEEEEPQGD